MTTPPPSPKGLMRFGIGILLLWTVVNLVMTVRLRAPSSVAEATTDTRTAVVLPVAGRDAVLAEMRLMLSSVQGVLAGAAQSDTAAIRTAAAASGLVMAADPALEKVLPAAFLQLGMGTHRAFDTLAAHAGSGPAAAIESLARITATCVSCHATYRLEVR